MADQALEEKPPKRKQDFLLDAFEICCPSLPGNKVGPEEASQDHHHHHHHPAVTDLTEREIYNFEKIWKLVQKHLPEIGKDVFVRLFSDHPLTSTAFDKFRGLEGAQLVDSVVLEVHGMVVMNTVDEIVSHLDEGPELIRDILKELGESHAKFGSHMKAEDFWNIEEAFVEAISENLGGLKQNAMALLKKTFKFLITGIVEGYEQEVERIKAEGKDALSELRSSNHSIGHKKLDLSEMIEKDMEEKIHQNEIQKNHHHHHHHHHHGHHKHHHHSHKHDSICRSTATNLNVTDEWLTSRTPQSSTLFSFSSSSVPRAIASTENFNAESITNVVVAQQPRSD